mgnify:CR=1 FL=1
MIILKKLQNQLEIAALNFLNDEFNSHKINNEFKQFKKKQDAVTKVMDNVQLAGSKVFQWKWAIIKK